MVWVILILMILILIGMVISLKGSHKVNINDKILVKYLFVYKIIEGDSKVLPTEFLVNWQISNLENHLYFVCLTLEEDLDIERYLHKVWVNYSELNNIYGKVYRVEGIMEVRNILIGTWEVVEGNIRYNEVK